MRRFAAPGAPFGSPEEIAAHLEQLLPVFEHAGREPLPAGIGWLIQSYQDVGAAEHLGTEEARAFRWSLAEVLIELAATNVALREKLIEIPESPPGDDPDCRAAWDAANRRSEFGCARQALQYA